MNRCIFIFVLFFLICTSCSQRFSNSSQQPHKPERGLFQALRAGDVEKAKELLASSAGIEERDENGRTPLHTAVSLPYPDHAMLDIMSLLVKNGANVNARDNAGWTPLNLAALGNNYERAKMLIENNADLNVEAEGYGTPLLVAARKNHTAIVELLRQHSADIGK